MNAVRPVLPDLEAYRGLKYLVEKTRPYKKISSDKDQQSAPS